MGSLTAGHPGPSTLLRRTPQLHQLLHDALQPDVALPSELREEARQLHAITHDAVPWRTAHTLCMHVRGSRRDGPWLSQMLQDGGGLHLPPPVPRKRAVALEERCQQLRAAAAEREYDSLTEDCSRRERDAAAVEPFSTYREALGLGAHVMVVMFTLFLLGQHVANSFSPSPIARLSGGLVGAAVGMMAETGLFIIRTTRE